MKGRDEKGNNLTQESVIEFIFSMLNPHYIIVEKELKDYYVNQVKKYGSSKETT